MPSSLFGPKPQSQQQANNSLGELTNLWNMFRNGGDSKKMAEMMLSRNPNYKAVMETINAYGGDARAAFYAEAQKRGVDPDKILSMLR